MMRLKQKMSSELSETAHEFAIFTKCPTINEMWNDNVEMTEELINEIKEVAEGIDEDEDLF